MSLDPRLLLLKFTPVQLLDMDADEYALLVAALDHLDH